MVQKELRQALDVLDGVPRFRHFLLPPIYPGSTGTHSIEVATHVGIFIDEHPKPHSLDKTYSMRLAANHDMPERFFRDRVAFAPDGRNNQRTRQIYLTSKWLNQSPDVPEMVIQFEQTADMLKGRIPLHGPRKREEILVAVEDLSSGAREFHLESVRGRHDPDAQKYYPLPISALMYAPTMLLQYKHRIPRLTSDRSFIQHLDHYINTQLHSIKGWWSVVPNEEIPRKFQDLLQTLHYLPK